MSSNFVHNILNALILLMGALGALATWAGCITLTDGSYDCSSSHIIPLSWIPYITIITGLLGAVKLIINISRDGLAGLVKVQPPVSDSIHTVVIPTNHGETLNVTRERNIV